MTDHVAETLAGSVEQAQALDYTNGMATEAVVLEREDCTIRVVRKAPHPTHPEIILFRAVPRGDRRPKLSAVEAQIPDAVGLYGDLDAQFTDDPEPTCVVQTPH